MYYINFGTGAGNETAKTLNEAMQYADDHAAYTQRDICIYDEDNNLVALRRWYGCEYDAENDYQDDPICFGNFGFYADWVEVD